LITIDDVLEGLRVEDLVFTDKEAFIRDCFDRFFEKLDYIQHLISIKLINFSDICDPIDYYANLMSTHKKTFHDFLTFYEYEGTLELLDRFDEWIRA
jgi:hypothetical protein